MKKILINILSIILIVISQSACKEKVLKNELVINTLDYKSREGKAYKYELNIPQIESENSEDLAYFNITMKEEARYIIENLSLKENDGGIKEAMISYKTYENNFSMLSISVLTSVYYGGAHPINKIEGYNFSLRDNTLVTFDKLFKEDGIEYFNMRINDIVSNKEKVLNTQGDEVIFFNNTEADIRNSVVIFEGDYIKFIFQNYDLAPYSSGMPVFKFNKKEVKKYLNI